jgi:hypothetical protein
MVFFLNSLSALLMLGLVYGWWKTKRTWFFLALVAVVVLYPMLQPSYMPKGEIKRTPVPGFLPSDAPIEARNREAETTEQRDARMKQTVEDGLPFIK